MAVKSGLLIGCTMLPLQELDADTIRDISTELRDLLRSNTEIAVPG
jgi:hypothetical protein